MSEMNVSNGGSIGFIGLLGIALIVLKLCGVITWSWFYIFLIMVSPILFVVLFVAIFAFLMNR